MCDPVCVFVLVLPYSHELLGVGEWGGGGGGEGEGEDVVQRQVLVCGLAIMALAGIISPLAEFDSDEQLLLTPHQCSVKVHARTLL